MRDATKASAPYSFGRDARLLKPADFQRVFAEARRSADRFFTVLYRENAKDAPRLGFAITKKVIPLATGRNRLRRIARESFRYQKRTLGGIDIIILAQNTARAASNRDLFASLERHWHNLANRRNQPRRPRRHKDKTER